MTMPGMNSYYFWTGIAPPTDTNLTNWMCLTDEEQAKNFRALQSASRPCVLFNYRVASFWNNALPRAMDAPIVRAVLENYRPGLIGRNWVMLVPNTRKAPVLQPPKTGWEEVGR